jgi:hypothetical protein
MNFKMADFLPFLPFLFDSRWQGGACFGVCYDFVSSRSNVSSSCQLFYPICYFFLSSLCVTCDCQDFYIMKQRKGVCLEESCHQHSFCFYFFI